MSLEKDITEIKKILEWSIKEIESDLLKLSSIQDHEEVWAFILRGDTLVYKDGFVLGYSKDWSKAKTHNDKGVYVDKEEIASAVKSSDADTVLVVHNHPVPKGEQHPVVYLGPSYGDVKSARDFDNFFEEFDLNIRFFIVGIAGIIEFDCSGDVVNKSINTPGVDSMGKLVGVLK
jgi:hypothetical protein